MALRTPLWFPGWEHSAALASCSRDLLGLSLGCREQLILNGVLLGGNRNSADFSLCLRAKQMEVRCSNPTWFKLLSSVFTCLSFCIYKIGITVIPLRTCSKYIINVIWQGQSGSVVGGSSLALKGCCGQFQVRVCTWVVG